MINIMIVIGWLVSVFLYLPEHAYKVYVFFKIFSIHVLIYGTCVPEWYTCKLHVDVQ